MNRRGFTLVELLVATAVFVFGFTAAFGMFLAALRYRTLADDTVKLSLAASSLPEEMAIGMVDTVVPLPAAPSHYLRTGSLLVYPGGATSDDLLPYPGVPGSWYTVESATDVLGGDDAASTTVHARILVLAFSQAQGTSLPLLTVWNRLRPRANDMPSGVAWPGFQATDLTPEQKAAFIDMLIRRGMAVRQTAVIVRRPGWMH
jgi:prepilin-type N-terminal cleavage/methylation domain-containing protein